MPSALVGQSMAVGEIPRRLTPIFRDRDDLPAAGNLNAEIQGALADSEFLIVLCSPNAATSRWVDEEVKLFKKLHGPDRTLAMIVAGEPGASAIPGREAEECFPPALRFAVDGAGRLTDEAAEPIAADARKDGDGRRFAILKLAAGLIGVGLDDLVQRDAHRRARGAWMWAGASTALTAVMGVLAAYAVDRGNEAKHMRGEAENLVQFMLTELRDKVEPVGRTDVLEAVGKEALAYYEGQNDRALDDDARARRARSLTLVGEIDMRRNSYDTALAAFEEALATSGPLVKRAPDNKDFIFIHAQSVFYVGEIAANRNEPKKAETQMFEYLRLAERLVELDGADPKWRLELAYATSNIGVMRFNEGDYGGAIPYFEKSAQARQVLFDEAPGDVEAAANYAYSLSWIAQAELRRGGFARAAATLANQMAVYEPILARDPENFSVLDPVVTAQRRLAEARLFLGDIEGSRTALIEARRTAEKLLARDAANANWKLNASHIERAFSYLDGLRGKTSEEAAAAERAAAIARALLKENASHTDAKAALMLALARKLSAASGPVARRMTAIELSSAFNEAIGVDSEKLTTAIGEAGAILAQLEDQSGRPENARKIRAEALARLSPDPKRLPILARVALAQLHLDASEPAAARALASELAALGLRHPGFVKLKEALAAPAGG